MSRQGCLGKKLIYSALPVNGQVAMWSGKKKKIIRSSIATNLLLLVCPETNFGLFANDFSIKNNLKATFMLTFKK